jgi:hypothetical protein
VAGRQEGKVPAPEPFFDKEQVRYEHRFGAFVSLMTPPLAPYSQYKVSIERNPCVQYITGTLNMLMLVI